MSYPDPLPDPLADEPDIEPTDPGAVEGKETDIPASPEPDHEDHAAVWPEEA